MLHASSWCPLPPQRPSDLQTMFVPCGMASLLRISPWQVECVAGAPPPVEQSFAATQLDWVAAIRCCSHARLWRLCMLDTSLWRASMATSRPQMAGVKSNHDLSRPPGSLMSLARLCGGLSKFITILKVCVISSALGAPQSDGLRGRRLVAGVGADGSIHVSRSPKEQKSTSTRSRRKARPHLVGQSTKLAKQTEVWKGVGSQSAHQGQGQGILSPPLKRIISG